MPRRRLTNPPRKNLLRSGTRPELRLPTPAAQTRIVSVPTVWLVARESAQFFKRIIFPDVSEFESYMPTHAVGLGNEESGHCILSLGLSSRSGARWPCGLFQGLALLVPREQRVEHRNPLKELTDEELEAMIEHLKASIEAQAQKVGRV